MSTVAHPVAMGRLGGHSGRLLQHLPRDAGSLRTSLGLDTMATYDRDNQRLLGAMNNEDGAIRRDRNLRRGGQYEYQ